MDNKNIKENSDYKTNKSSVKNYRKLKGTRKLTEEEKIELKESWVRGLKGAEKAYKRLQDEKENKDSV